jgi:arylsulfatase A-like enzyme/tetratricopeptide (TPR) repeat protein
VEVPAGTPVILISVDTLRSDRLPMYGYDAIETPALDALRRDAILFERAYSPMPLTLPSHSSMLTGLLPAGHGVRDNGGYSLETEGLPWLPGILREEGYRTGAAVSAFVLRGGTGLGADFDLYEDHIVQKQWPGSVQRTGDLTLEASRDWLRGTAGEPFFFFFHIFEPHRPYDPPEPFASRYGVGYDAEVASADRIVGDLVAELKALGVYDRALIFFVSDHGEGLGDHGLEEHGLFLYREQIQVPLLVKLPGSERGGTSVERPAHLVDLAPTVLGLLGLDPPESLDGVSLLAPAEEVGDRPLFAETLYPRLSFGWSELSSVILWPYHYIHGPDPELYDLASDPGETENIFGRDRRTSARLRSALRSFDLDFEPPAPAEPETRSRLAALGYLGGARAGAEGPLADPKTKLPVLDRLGEAFRLLRRGEFSGAEERYRQIVREEPQIVDAWRFLGHSLVRQGRPEEALEAYHQASTLTSGAPEDAVSIAEALLGLQRIEEAEQYAELALEALPADAHHLLALISLRRQDTAGAERHAERALELQEERLLPRITLARIALAEGDPQRALERTGEVLERVPDDLPSHLLRGLYVTRGEAFAQLGRPEEAERAFLEGIRLFPNDLAAYTRLAVLYALTGKTPAVAETLQRMLNANPTPDAYAEAARTLRVLGDPSSAEHLLREARRRWPESEKLRRSAG